MSLDVEAPAGGWELAMRSVSEERLLLLEMVHRVANEVAAALAALRMIRPAAGSKSRWRLLAGAVERLEGFAVVNRVLAISDADAVDLSAELERLCLGVAAARPGGASASLSLDLAEVVVAGPVARRVLLVAAELLLNSIRHGLRGGRGQVSVILRKDGCDVTLAVIDQGPGLDAARPAAGSGLGGPLVAELVRRGGGVIGCRIGPDGTSFDVRVPHVSSRVAGAAHD